MSLELNKIGAAILFALLVGKVSGMVAEGVLPVETKLAKDSYPIAGAEAAPAAAAAPVADEKPAPIPAEMFAKADPAHGAEIAKKCAQCHSFGKGEPNHVGPNLWDVIGRPRASAPGFSYSDTLKGLGGSWSPQEIAAFIYKPSAYAPGTKMSFAGLPKPEERADVLAYLNTQSDHPVDLK